MIEPSAKGSSSSSSRPSAEDVEGAINEFVAEYEFDDGDGGIEQLTEREQIIITDAIHGLLADETFVKCYQKAGFGNTYSASISPAEDVRPDVIVTDDCGQQWDRKEWLEMGGGERQWDTIAWLTAKLAEAERQLAEYRADARKLRVLLAYVYAGGAMLYTDDGELQDNLCRPLIDFKRDTPDELEAKMIERSRRKADHTTHLAERGASTKEVDRG